MRGVLTFGTPFNVYLPAITKMSNEILNIMAGLFIMFVMALALSGLVNDYLHSVSDSDDSEPTPLIVFTQDDDNNDWQKDEPIKKIGVFV